jgi:MFS family permease
MTSSVEQAGESPYAALRVRPFLSFLLGHILSVLGVQMQTVAVGWELYERTNSAWALGLVGLIMAGPMIGLAPIAGQTADRMDRRRLLMIASWVAVVSSLGLTLVSLAGGGIGWIYFCLLGSGLARAFQGPARSSLMPLLVPRPLFSNAVTWAVSGFEMASMVGPALGGILIAAFGGAQWVYALSAAGSLLYVVMLGSIKGSSYRASRSSTSENTGEGGRSGWQSLMVGFTYVGSNRLLLTIMTLDLLAILLGGAVALLPIFARDILQVGPRGLGWLQAAPPLGAMTMALLTVHLPPIRRAGRALLWAVGGFGVTTLIFGLSTHFWLSLVMLFLTGAFDNISVVIRQTMVQLLTPDEMRGRVSAVNGMFINASNEIGRFRAGAMAGLTGPIFSVVGGGVACLLVVLVIAARSAPLRAYGSLVGEREEIEEEAPRGESSGTS